MDQKEKEINYKENKDNMVLSNKAIDSHNLSSEQPEKNQEKWIVKQYSGKFRKETIDYYIKYGEKAKLGKFSLSEGTLKFGLPVLIKKQLLHLLMGGIKIRVNTTWPWIKIWLIT